MTAKSNQTKSYPSTEHKDLNMHEAQGEYNTQGKSATEFVIPEGYVTGDEFEKRVMEGLEKRLRDNGYL